MYYFAYGVKIHSRPPHYFPTANSRPPLNLFGDFKFTHPITTTSFIPTAYILITSVLNNVLSGLSVFFFPVKLIKKDNNWKTV